MHLLRLKATPKGLLISGSHVPQQLNLQETSKNMTAWLPSPCPAPETVSQIKLVDWGLPRHLSAPPSGE